MGLDQYLYASKYSSRLFDEDTFEKLKSALGDDKKYLNENLPSISLKIKVGYWRKSNQIHKWFVNTCQKGNDDCGTYSIRREHLQSLKETCEQVLADKSKAVELLPVQEGFFFGSNEYNEYYFSDLSRTVETLNKCLKMGDDWDFEYESSW